jgi:GDP-mannose 6-dehydrogenase
MKISVFGLGYVGAVSAGILASEGHRVIGVDPNQTKLDLINAGKSPIIEPQIGDLISSSVAEGRLSATDDAFSAVNETDISFVCVGTPSQHNGNLDLSFVSRVCEEIGAAIGRKDSFHVVVLRSTMLPGTMEEVVIPTLTAASGKTLGTGFGVCMNPEFLREGSAVNDYRNPPKIVIGESDRKSGDRLVELYEMLEAPLFRTDIATAEMVKYADNAWHALKVTFANEIGTFCKSTKIDSHQVMDIFCHDTKLNLSPYYMRPGFSFGGSCLPKDVRALTYRAKRNDLDLPLLNSIMPSNEAHFIRGVEMVTRSGNSKVGILGLSFKAGTDDLRESPILTLVEYLIGKGYDLRIYDKNVNLAKLVGANRDYILNRIPHISKLMVDSLQEVLRHAETVVVGNNSEEFQELFSRTNGNQVIVDLVRIAGQKSKEGHYEGICW